MIISSVSPYNDHVLKVTTEDDKIGYFDISPYLESEAFHKLKDKKELEWDCGADLSSDTIEAHLMRL